MQLIFNRYSENTFSAVTKHRHRPPPAKGRGGRRKEIETRCLRTREKLLWKGRSLNRTKCIECTKGAYTIERKDWPVALAWNSDVDGRCCVGLWRSTCFRFTAHPVTRFMVEDLWAGFTGALPSRKPGFADPFLSSSFFFFFFIFSSFSFSPPPPPPPLIWSRQTRDGYFDRRLHPRRIGS